MLWLFWNVNWSSQIGPKNAKNTRFCQKLWQIQVDGGRGNIPQLWPHSFFFESCLYYFQSSSFFVILELKLKKKWWNPHLFWILMDLITGISYNFRTNYPKLTKVISSKKSGFLQMFLKKYLSEFFGFCQDLKLVFMRFHELIPSTSYHHSKNKKWRKKQISKISARDKRYKNSYRTSINIDWNLKKCSKTWKNKIFKKYWKTFSTVNLVILWYL